VDEIAKDREGAGVSVIERKRDGIANAEAHAEVRRSNDTHRIHVPLSAIPAAIVLAAILTVTHPAMAKNSVAAPAPPIAFIGYLPA
jgi:hypothetical protein